MNETVLAEPIDETKTAWLDAYVEHFVKIAKGNVVPEISEEELRLFARIAGDGGYDVFKNDPPTECADAEWEEWKEASR